MRRGTIVVARVTELGLPSNHKRESDCSPDARKHVLCRFRQPGRPQSLVHESITYSVASAILPRPFLPIKS